SRSFSSCASRAPADYPLSLHDALPIFDMNRDVIRRRGWWRRCWSVWRRYRVVCHSFPLDVEVFDFERIRFDELPARFHGITHKRSEEHTSELQSLRHLVCRPLLEKKNE